MKFFLDNCLAIRHARALNEMVQPEHSFTHLQDKFAANTTDVDWITALGKEGGWIVISGDYRIGKSAHEREAWQRSGLTVFFLKKGWTNLPPLQQHSKLASMRPFCHIALSALRKDSSEFSVVWQSLGTLVHQKRTELTLSAIKCAERFSGFKENPEQLGKRND